MELRPTLAKILSQVSPWFSWRAALAATIVGAIVAITLLAAFAWHAGRLDGEAIFFLIVLALPAALFLAAPIAFVVFPLASLALDRLAAHTTLRLMAIGAAVGIALPLAVALKFKARLVSESWAVTAIFIVAAMIAGVVGALIYDRARSGRA